MSPFTNHFSPETAPEQSPFEVGLSAVQHESTLAQKMLHVFSPSELAHLNETFFAPNSLSPESLRHNEEADVDGIIESMKDFVHAPSGLEFVGMKKELAYSLTEKIKHLKQNDSRMADTF